MESTLQGKAKQVECQWAQPWRAPWGTKGMRFPIVSHYYLSSPDVGTAEAAGGSSKAL